MTGKPMTAEILAEVTVRTTLAGKSLDALRDAEAFWRGVVAKVKMQVDGELGGERCPFCHAEDWDRGPIMHAADCPWVIATKGA